MYNPVRKCIRCISLQKQHISVAKIGLMDLKCTRLCCTAHIIRIEQNTDDA